MSLFTRSKENPILSPNPNNAWESKAAFNGSILKKDGYQLFYRAIGNPVQIKTKTLELSTIGRASSLDGLTFTDRQPYIYPEYDWELFGCEDPRVTEIDGQIITCYTAIASYPPSERTIRVAVAIQKPNSEKLEKHLVTPFNAKAMTILPEKIAGKYVAILTVHTDSPPSNIAIATFEKLETLWDPEFWENWHAHLDDHILNLKRLTSDQVEVGATPIKTPAGWVMIYSYIKDYFTDHKIFTIEAALLDLENPQLIRSRITESLLTPEAEYELHGMIDNIVFPSSALIEPESNSISLYYGAADTNCARATADLSEFMSKFETVHTVRAKRFANNPLLCPQKAGDWEDLGVFNPAAITLDGMVYIIYRAQSSSHQISQFGLAISSDGYYIDERLTVPIYTPRVNFEKTDIPNAGQGCEDPRVTVLDNKLYLCYTAYDGRLPRLAMSSITIEDFKARHFDKWSLPLILSKDNLADKDGCLFPEKVNDRFVFFHRLEQSVYVDSIADLQNPTPLFGEAILSPRPGYWDDLKVGINTVPIKTKAGWLVFYHGISNLDHNYRLGAFLLDLETATKITARSLYPILEPEKEYEKNGVVNNVVFPCGHVLQDDTILLYYGGADKYVCGASLSLSQLLAALVATEEN